MTLSTNAVQSHAVAKNLRAHYKAAQMNSRTMGTWCNWEHRHPSQSARPDSPGRLLAVFARSPTARPSRNWLAARRCEKSVRHAGRSVREVIHRTSSVGDGLPQGSNPGLQPVGEFGAHELCGVAMQQTKRKHDATAQGKRGKQTTSRELDSCQRQSDTQLAQAHEDLVAGIDQHTMAKIEDHPLSCTKVSQGVGFASGSGIPSNTDPGNFK